MGDEQPCCDDGDCLSGSICRFDAASCGSSPGVCVDCRPADDLAWCRCDGTVLPHRCHGSDNDAPVDWSHCGYAPGSFPCGAATCSVKKEVCLEEVGTSRCVPKPSSESGPAYARLCSNEPFGVTRTSFGTYVYCR